MNSWNYVYSCFGSVQPAYPNKQTRKVDTKDLKSFPSISAYPEIFLGSCIVTKHSIPQVANAWNEIIVSLSSMQVDKENDF